MQIASIGLDLAKYRGARASSEQDPRSLWLGSMRQRRHPNIVAVALANKNARIAVSLVTSDSVYDASHAA